MALPNITDAYGIDVQITPQGDLGVTPSGGLALISGPENCVQALTLRLKSSPGDLPLHPDYGSQFNTTAVGAKADFELLGGLAGSELSRILDADRRFVQATNVEVVPVQSANGLGAEVRATLYLTTGASVVVADMAQPRISEVVDPAFPDISPSTIDPLDFTAAASNLEADVLADLSEVQSLIYDGT